MKEGRIPGWEALLLSHPNREHGLTEYLHCCLLDHNIQSDTGLPTFQRKTLLCNIYLEDGGSLLMGSSEMLIRKYQTTRHHTPSDSSLPNYVRRRKQ
jgi:hypothetical protein